MVCYPSSATRFTGPRRRFIRSSVSFSASDLQVTICGRSRFAFYLTVDGFFSTRHSIGREAQKSVGVRFLLPRIIHKRYAAHFFWITSYISNQSYDGNQLTLPGFPSGPVSCASTIKYVRTPKALVRGSHSHAWYDSMQRELHSLIARNTWREGYILFFCFFFG